MRAKTRGFSARIMGSLLRLTLKIVRVGNSKGVRLPKGRLARHRIGATVTEHSTERGILFAPSKAKRLGWDDTFRAMAAAKDDDFAVFDPTVADGGEDAR